jgi:hypothetical protein
MPRIPVLPTQKFLEVPWGWTLVNAIASDDVFLAFMGIFS